MRNTNILTIGDEQYKKNANIKVKFKIKINLNLTISDEQYKKMPIL